MSPSSHFGVVLSTPWLSRLPSFIPGVCKSVVSLLKRVPDLVFFTEILKKQKGSTFPQEHTIWAIVAGTSRPAGRTRGQGARPGGRGGRACHMSRLSCVCRKQPLLPRVPRVGRPLGLTPPSSPEVRAPTAGDGRCPRLPASGAPVTSACRVFPTCLCHVFCLFPVAPCGRLSPPCDGDGARGPQGPASSPAAVRLPPTAPAGWGRRPFPRAPKRGQATGWPLRL